MVVNLREMDSVRFELVFESLSKCVGDSVSQIGTAEQAAVMADIISWPIMTIIIIHKLENYDWWNHGHIDNGGWFWFLMQIETEYSSWAAVKADFASITGTIVDIWTFFIFNNVYHGPLSVIMVMIIKTQKKQLNWVERWQLCHGNHHNNCWPFSSGH